MNTKEIKKELQEIIENSSSYMLKEYYSVLKSYISEIESVKTMEVYDYHIVSN